MLEHKHEGEGVVLWRVPNPSGTAKPKLVWEEEGHFPL